MAFRVPPAVSRRTLLRGSASTAAAVALAACGSGRALRGVDVRDLGAVGDGRTDDTDALLRAMDAVPAGGVLLVPAAHVFCHARVLVLAVHDATVRGGGELRATSEETSALWLMADGIGIDGLVLSVAATTRRWSAPAQHKLVLGCFDHLTVRDLAVRGSAATGVFVDGTRGFGLDAVTVADTRADGIHMTNGASDGVVTAPTVTRSGDDGVAVVSYAQDGAACRDIRVTAPVVRTTGGRGVSVVGGSRVSYSDIDVVSSAAAAVYVACEPAPYFTASTTAVTVVGGRVVDANTDPTIDHGAVLVYAGQGSVSEVQIRGLTVSGTRLAASRQIGAIADGAGSVSAVTFADLSLAAAPRPYEGNVPESDVALEDVRGPGGPVRS